MNAVLKADDLIEAYSMGYFPMAHPELNNRIMWHRPEMRGLIPIDARFHVPENLRRFLNKEPFTYTLNAQFKLVMEKCAERKNGSTWITPEIIQAYCELNERGLALSIEAWKGEELAGALYGVCLGRAFFGESMFHRITNASKASLVFLVDYLRKNNFLLLDSQYLNAHLLQFGAFEIPDKEYMKKLKNALPKGYTPRN
jgi:leucyl/phenylalanyl-tRNA--protein transferase